MSKHTFTLTITYNLKGALLKQYKEWLGDYKDTKSARKSFLLDQFAPEDWKEILDPRAKMSYREY
jgi:hypothetical protein